MELARHACRQLAEQPLTAPERVVAEADLVAELMAEGAEPDPTSAPPWLDQNR